MTPEAGTRRFAILAAILGLVPVPLLYVAALALCQSLMLRWLPLTTEVRPTVSRLAPATLLVTATSVGTAWFAFGLAEAAVAPVPVIGPWLAFAVPPTMAGVVTYTMGRVVAPR
ncbi:MAG: hypothetical protein AB7O67_08310 [Vicinamibacterales bacterium]